MLFPESFNSLLNIFLFALISDCQKGSYLGKELIHFRCRLRTQVNKLRIGYHTDDHGIPQFAGAFCLDVLACRRFRRSEAEQTCGGFIDYQMIFLLPITFTFLRCQQEWPTLFRISPIDERAARPQRYLPGFKEFSADRQNGNAEARASITNWPIQINRYTATLRIVS